MSNDLIARIKTIAEWMESASRSPIPTALACRESAKVHRAAAAEIERAEVSRQTYFNERNSARDAVRRKNTEIERLKTDGDVAQEALRRHGFVQCDITGCNCGSWHARYGLRERFDEIQSALEDAGIDLNGTTILKAVVALIAERDAKDAEIRGRRQCIEQHNRACELSCSRQTDCGQCDVSFPCVSTGLANCIRRPAVSARAGEGAE